MKKNIENIVKHSEVSEKVIEKYLSEKVAECGGVCLKYSNSGVVGYPDRVVLLPNGKTAWVELKSKGKKPSLIQKCRFEQMERLGHNVIVIDSKDEVNNLIKMWRNEK